MDSVKYIDIFVSSFDEMNSICLKDGFYKQTKIQSTNQKTLIAFI